MPSACQSLPNFHVTGEQFVPIHHNVLTNAKDFSKVSRIYSHPQVWGQVTGFLNSSNDIKRLTRIDTPSTAEAAKIVSEDTSNSSACISSSLSAELYHLPVFVHNVEDMKENTTRFLVLGAESVNNDVPEDLGGAKYITSLMFTLNGNDPGALCEALYSFKVNNVNLHSIASRPSGKAQWEYVFFVEVEGHMCEEQVKKSLKDLQASCSQTVVLGLFVREKSLN